MNRFKQTTKTRYRSKNNTTNGNLDRAGGAIMFLITEETKQTVLNFSKGMVKVLWFYFVLIKYWY